MPRVYTDLDRTDLDLFNEVMATYRPDLLSFDVRIKPVMVKKVDKDGEVTPALKLAGAPVAGLARVTSLKQRFLGHPDGIVELDGAAWSNKPVETRRALIHHELHHFIVKMDPEAENDHAVLLDDVGRPKLTLRPDDWLMTGFYAIVEKHGEFAGEYQSVRYVHNLVDEAARRFAREVAVNA